jgi:hypothetical protein
MKRIVHSAVPAAIARRDGFRASNMTGEWYAFPTGTGWMHPAWAARFSDSWPDVRVDRWLTSRIHLYVVFSYATPIAWFSPIDGWTVPDVWYSPSTHQHQQLVYAAVGRQIAA